MFEKYTKIKKTLHNLATTTILANDYCIYSRNGKIRQMWQNMSIFFMVEKHQNSLSPLQRFLKCIQANVLQL